MYGGIAVSGSHQQLIIVAEELEAEGICPSKLEFSTFSTATNELFLK